MDESLARFVHSGCASVWLDLVERELAKHTGQPEVYSRSALRTMNVSMVNWELISLKAL